jgi:hypothetical protein
VRTEMKGDMRKFMWWLVPVLCLCGCATPGHDSAGARPKQVLEIRWQRLVDAKRETCDRCGATEKATEKAVRQLRRSLKLLNVEVLLEKTTLDASSFAKAPLESNRIWIAGRPIEEWLGAKVSQSPCCGACGDSECRTLMVDGRAYEGTPAELIVRAGLKAGQELAAGPAQQR